MSPHQKVHENTNHEAERITFPVSFPLLQKHSQSIFSDIFEGFPMPSYSNYPYPYMFDNYEEQYKISQIIREKVEEIKSKSPRENFMNYETASNGLQIVVSRDGQTTSHNFTSREKDIYLLATEKSQRVSKVLDKLGMASANVRAILDDFEQKGLILFSHDRKSFLSLAREYKKAC
jgi:hypothetical protein